MNNLSQDQISLIVQTLNVPMYAFGEEQFKKDLGSDIEEVPNLIDYLNSKLTTENDNHILDEKYSSLLEKSYSSALNIIGEREFHALTGYDWSTGQELRHNLTH